MTLSFDTPNFDVDSNDILNGTAPRTNTFRVGDKAILVGGAYVGAYDDDGVVFNPVKFADDSGLGLGRLDTYYVHDNRDGTMTVFYQIRDAEPLPTQITNWRVTLDAETGAATGAATQITSGVFGRTDQAMLEKAFGLPDGNIAVIHANSSLSSAQLIIARADGTEIGRSGSVMAGNVFDIYGQYDLAVVGNRLLVAWTETASGAARETFMQFFDMSGAEIGTKTTVSQGISSGFGHLGAVQVETLSDGRFVVVWVEALTTGSDADGSSTWFRIYNADGSVSVDTTRVNTNTAGNQQTPLLIATEGGFIVGFTAFEFSPAFKNEGRLKEYDNNGVLLDEITNAAYLAGADDLIRIDKNTALLLTFEGKELILPGGEGSLDPAPVTPVGTSGNDVHVGTAAKDVWNGKAGHDSFRGLAGNDDIRGGAGNDVLRGDDGKDKIRGDGGNDTLIGGAGGDTLIGGKGKDTASYEDAATAVKVDLSVASFGTGEAKGDTFTGIENLTGSARGDVLKGTNGKNVISGLNGADTLFGKGGGDTLKGDNGNDVLNGGSGNDLLLGGKGKDVLRGDDGNDILRGQAGRDTFVFDGGADVVADFSGDRLRFDDALWGGGARTKAQIMAFASVAGTDTVFDFGGGNTLTVEDETDLTGLQAIVGWV